MEVQDRILVLFYLRAAFDTTGASERRAEEKQRHAACINEVTETEVINMHGKSWRSTDNMTWDKNRDNGF